MTRPARQRGTGPGVAPRGTLDQVLWGQAPGGVARLAQARRLGPVYRRVMRDAGIVPAPEAFLPGFVLPILDLVAAQVAGQPNRRAVIGLAGGPGVGKTTLSALLVALLPLVLKGAPGCFSVSIDDFYFDAGERQRRGFAWRTLPGTHDTDRMARLLRDFDRGGAALEVPRFDLGRDAPAPPRLIKPGAQVCLFDGAMVGARLPGYDVLARRLDLLIFLDAPLELLRHWRLSREARLRARSQGAEGFSPARMLAFWDEALAPSVRDHVTPNRGFADLVIRLGPDRVVQGALRQNRLAPGPFSAKDTR